MTIGTDPEPAAWRLRWAGEQLGVDAEASAAEARAALLRRLPEVDFVPPPEWREALRILSGEAPRPGAVDEAARAEEERLRDEVEEFADCFWSLAPSRRRERWGELLGRCAEIPALRTRLRLLEPGLDLASFPAGGDDPLVAELAGQVQTLFVLRPAERALAWRALLRRIEGQMGAWEAAARKLKKRHRALAGLEPDRLSELASWSSRQKHLVWMRRRLRGWPGVRAEKKKNLKLSWLVLVWFGLSAIAGVFRGISGESSPQTETQRWTPPPVVYPRQPINQPGDRELKKILEDLQKHQKGPGELPRRSPAASGAKDKGADGGASGQGHGPSKGTGRPAD
jgi:hypothetical protein